MFVVKSTGDFKEMKRLGRLQSVITLWIGICAFRSTSCVATAECGPVVEGTPHNITCHVVGSWRLLEWKFKTGSDVLSSFVSECRAGEEECDNMYRGQFVASMMHKNDSGEAGNSSSTLSIASVSRTTSRWLGLVDGVAACSCDLHVYVPPKAVSCDRQYIVHLLGVTRLLLECSGLDVYPTAQCVFYSRTEEGVEAQMMDAEIHYQHFPVVGTQNFDSYCTLIMESPAEGLQVKVNMFPALPGVKPGDVGIESDYTSLVRQTNTGIIGTPPALSVLITCGVPSAEPGTHTLHCEGTTRVDSVIKWSATFGNGSEVAIASCFPALGLCTSPVPNQYNATIMHEPLSDNFLSSLVIRFEASLEVGHSTTWKCTVNGSIDDTCDLLVGEVEDHELDLHHQPVLEGGICPQSSPNVKDGYIKSGTTATCKCQVSDFLPGYLAQWYLLNEAPVGVSDSRTGEATLKISDYGLEQLRTQQYSCVVTSSDGETSSSLVFNAKFAYGPESLTLNIDDLDLEKDQPFFLCSAEERLITVHCDVEGSDVNPAPIFDLAVNATEVVSAGVGSNASAGLFRQSHSFRPQAAGNLRISCTAKNTKFPDILASNFLTVNIIGPHSVAPKLSISDKYGNGSDLVVTSGVLTKHVKSGSYDIVAHCDVTPTSSPQAPRVDRVEMTCGGFSVSSPSYQATLALGRVDENSNSTVCTCWARHTYSCFDQRSDLVFIVDPRPVESGNSGSDPLPMYAGIGAGSLVLLLVCIITAVTLVTRRRQQQHASEGERSYDAMDPTKKQTGSYDAPVSRIQSVRLSEIPDEYSEIYDTIIEGHGGPYLPPPRAHHIPQDDLGYDPDGYIVPL